MPCLGQGWLAGLGAIFIGVSVFDGFRVGAAEQILKASADTVLFANNPTNNLGASDLLAVGATGKGFPARSLLRFDLASGIPAGAVILEARLEFQMMRGPGGDEGSGIRAHRMRVDWAEGRGKGNLGEPARAGEATWTFRSYPDVPWSAPGGAPGVEFAETASGMTVVNDLGTYVIGGPGILQDVQAWLASPETHHGWILLSDREDTKLTARRLGSRESAEVGAIPRLVLVLGETAPLRIDRWRIGEGRIEIGFRAEAGNIFEVQYRDLTVPGLGAWGVLTNFIVKLQSRDVLVSEPLKLGGAVAYRVADVGDVD